MSFRIIRVYFQKPGYAYTMADHLTQEEAQAYCADPETSSSTCTLPAKKRITKRNGPWMECYVEN